MEERQAELRKQYKKEHWNSIKDFFKFPQIVGSFTLIVSIYILLNFFSNALAVGMFIYLTGFVLISIESFKLFKLRKKEKQKILRVETFLNEKLLIVMMIPQVFFNGIIPFKDTIDSNHFIIKIIVALILTYCFLSLFVFRKLAKNEIAVVNRLYFS
jgi:fatty acid desaturase